MFHKFFPQGPKGQKSRILPWIQRIGFVVIVGLILWFLPRIHFQEVKESILTANVFYILLTLPCLILFWCSRVTLLWLLLHANHHKTPLRWRLILGTTLLGGMIDQIIPGRSGYLVRWGVLSLTTSLTKSFVFSALLLSAVIEGFVLLSLFVVSFGFSEEVSSFGSSQLAFIFFIILLLIFLKILFLDKFKINFEHKWLSKITPLKAFHDMSVHLRKPILLLPILGSAFLTWGIELLLLKFLALAFHLPLTLVQILILLVGLNLAIVVPVVPANVGTLQVVMTAILSKMSVAPETALAYSLVFHVSQALPLFLGGFISYHLLSRRLT